MKGLRPEDIPSAPRNYYGDQWKGFGDWLGTDNISHKDRKLRPFAAARDFARRLKLNSGAEWKEFCNKGHLPRDIPKNPRGAYASKGWKSMGDWLGTGRVAAHLRPYRDFKRARRYVRGLRLKSWAEWISFTKGKQKPLTLPADIPASPQRTYAERGWVSWGDWLGTKSVATQKKAEVYLPFQAARSFVHGLHLNSQAQWISYIKGGLSAAKGNRPANIPAYPEQTYARKGWRGMGDWLGTGRVATHLRQYRDFDKARKFVRSLRLKSQQEWSKFCRGKLPQKGLPPADIPATPAKVYKDKGWQNLGDWLGTGRVASRDLTFMPFVKARSFARSLSLRSGEEWNLFCRGRYRRTKGTLPEGVPRSPRTSYAKTGWVSMGDWLGTGTVAGSKKQFLPFREARAFVRSLQLSNLTEWQSYCRGDLSGRPERPDNIPTAPMRTYANTGWINLADWLGTDRKRKAKRRW